MAEIAALSMSTSSLRDSSSLANVDLRKREWPINLRSAFLGRKPTVLQVSLQSAPSKNLSRQQSRSILCSVIQQSQTQAPESVTVTSDGQRVECFGVFCVTYDVKQDEKPKSWKKLLRIAVSGAAGTISNHLLFKIASGEVFGPDQPVALSLLGSDRSRNALEGLMASSATSISEIKEDSIASTSKDLLVIGPGVLGRLVAGLWMKDNPGCGVVGETATTTHHEELESLGIRPVVKGSQGGLRFPYVMFCAPPSGSLDYAAELRLAAEQWNGDGVFLFTSSSAVYDCSDNGACDEDTPIVPLGRSPRTDVLLKAEHEVLRVGGTVVRLAGLYTFERGPHAYWAKKGTVDARPDHILNLIHYEDAASLCMTILKKGYQKQVFMGCDNHPLSRQELMDIVNESGKLKDKFEAFTGVDGPLGKKMNCDKTRSITGWQPKFTSFAEFLGVAP